MDGRGRLAQSLKPMSGRTAFDAAPAAPARFIRIRRSARRWLTPLLELEPPQGIGALAVGILLAASSAYGVVRGGHIEDLTAGMQNICDRAANSAGMQISSIALSGETQLSREDILTLAGVSGRSSLLCLDAAAARDKLKTSPWIADATVLKLYPGRLQIEHQGARRLRAVAEGRAGFRDRRRRHRARAVLPASASPRCRWWSARARRSRRRTSSRWSAVIRRCATPSKPRCWSPTGAGICGSRAASMCGCRKTSRGRRCRLWCSSTATRSCCRATSSMVDLRLADRVTVRLSDAGRAGARGSGQRDDEEREGQEERRRTHDRAASRPHAENETGVAAPLRRGRCARYRHQQRSSA